MNILPDKSFEQLSFIAEQASQVIQNNKTQDIYIKSFEEGTIETIDKSSGLSRWFDRIWHKMTSFFTGKKVLPYDLENNFAYLEKITEEVQDTAFEGMDLKQEIKCIKELNALTYIINNIATEKIEDASRQEALLELKVKITEKIASIVVKITDKAGEDIANTQESDSLKKFLEEPTSVTPIIEKRVHERVHEIEALRCREKIKEIQEELETLPENDPSNGPSREKLKNDQIERYFQKILHEAALMDPKEAIQHLHKDVTSWIRYDQKYLEEHPGAKEFFNKVAEKLLSLEYEQITQELGSFSLDSEENVQNIESLNLLLNRLHFYMEHETVFEDKAGSIIEKGNLLCAEIKKLFNQKKAQLPRDIERTLYRLDLLEQERNLQIKHKELLELHKKCSEHLESGKPPGSIQKDVDRLFELEFDEMKRMEEELLKVSFSNDSAVESLLEEVNFQLERIEFYEENKEAFGDNGIRVLSESDTLVKLVEFLDQVQESKKKSPVEEQVHFLLDRCKEWLDAEIVSSSPEVEEMFLKITYHLYGLESEDIRKQLENATKVKLAEIQKELTRRIERYEHVESFLFDDLKVELYTLKMKVELQRAQLLPLNEAITTLNQIKESYDNDTTFSRLHTESTDLQSLYGILEGYRMALKYQRIVANWDEKIQEPGKKEDVQSLKKMYQQNQDILSVQVQNLLTVQQMAVPSIEDFPREAEVVQEALEKIRDAIGKSLEKHGTVQQRIQKALYEKLDFSKFTEIQNKVQTTEHLSELFDCLRELHNEASLVNEISLVHPQIGKQAAIAIKQIQGHVLVQFTKLSSKERNEIQKEFDEKSNLIEVTRRLCFYETVITTLNEFLEKEKDLLGLDACKADIADAKKWIQWIGNQIATKYNQEQAKAKEPQQTFNVHAYTTGPQVIMTGNVSHSIVNITIQSDGILQNLLPQLLLQAAGFPMGVASSLGVLFGSSLSNIGAIQNSAWSALYSAGFSFIGGTFYNLCSGMSVSQAVMMASAGSVLVPVMTVGMTKMLPERWGNSLSVQRGLSMAAQLLFTKGANQYLAYRAHEVKEITQEAARIHRTEEVSPVSFGDQKVSEAHLSGLTIEPSQPSVFNVTETTMPQEVLNRTPVAGVPIVVKPISVEGPIVIETSIVPTEIPVDATYLGAATRASDLFHFVIAMGAIFSTSQRNKGNF